MDYHDCVPCDQCGHPMLPNISTLDEHGYGWSCINFYCPDGREQMEEVEAEDLEAVGLPMQFAKDVEKTFTFLGYLARMTKQLQDAIEYKTDP